jgi:hypothetical protein
MTPSSPGDQAAPRARPPALALFPTDALLDELARRSLGCLAVCVRVEEEARDVWRYRLKGSSVLLGAMSAALHLQAEREAERRAAAGLDDLGGPPPG